MNYILNNLIEKGFVQLTKKAFFCFTDNLEPTILNSETLGPSKGIVFYLDVFFSPVIGRFSSISKLLLNNEFISH